MRHQTNTNEIPLVKPTEEPPKKTYVPIGDLVAVHAFSPKKVKGGILLPDTMQDPNQFETQTAVVISAGPDCKWVKDGDLILIAHRMQAIVHDGQTTGIVNEKQIAGIIIQEKVES